MKFKVIKRKIKKNKITWLTASVLVNPIPVSV